MTPESIRIGIDVGGTFTDLFLWSSEGGVETFKVLSTPRDPSRGVLDGLEAIAAAHDMTLAELGARISTIVHGTTVTTNAVLTRGGARTGLVTTEGVRDALEMRRGIREDRYDNRLQNVVPLVPRHLRLPVKGRLDSKGDERTALDSVGLRRAAASLKKAGVAAVAICFMNSFADPAQERAAKQLLEGELDGVYVCASFEVLPVVRFYNRVSTTVLNAYVGPVLDDYLGHLVSRLEEIGFGGVLLIMQSNGGVALPELSRRQAATTLLSGPAGGPRAAVAFTRPHGRDDCILIDMGGTSFDASLVRDGAAAMSKESEIARLRIALPMLAIKTIGAGGGSIGWIDAGGLLRMGPRSAGSDPGPACYGRGAQEPACTDADLVLGYLDPEFFAGGQLRLDVESAHRAIATRIAQPLGLTTEEAAAGMYRVINSNMAHGVRAITIERGLDPREFPLVVAGGAGALHACRIADELEIPSLVVPATASVLCAAGMLLSDLQHDSVRTCISPLDELDPALLNSVLSGMMADGTDDLAAEGIEPARMTHEIALDLRYLKQYHEVTLPLPAAAVEGDHFDGVRSAFHAEHNRLYGYDLEDEGTGIELINVRVRSVGRTDKPPLPTLDSGSRDSSHARKGARRAYLPEHRRFERIPVYDGHRFASGNVIAGPALIERTDTTLFVTGRYVARIDGLGSCLLERS